MSWNDYATAVVRVYLPTGPVIVAPQPPGTVEGAFPAELGAGPAAVVTAYNPHGELASESVNRSAHVALINRLDREGRTWFPAVGGDPSWTHTEETSGKAWPLKPDEDHAVPSGGSPGTKSQRSNPSVVVGKAACSKTAPVPATTSTRLWVARGCRPRTRTRTTLWR